MKKPEKAVRFNSKRSGECHRTFGLRYAGIDPAERGIRISTVKEESAAIERRGLKMDEKG